MVANKTTVECARSWNQTASQSVASRDHWSEQLKHADAAFLSSMQHTNTNSPIPLNVSFQLGPLECTSGQCRSSMQMPAFGSLSLQVQAAVNNSPVTLNLPSFQSGVETIGVKSAAEACSCQHLAVFLLSVHHTTANGSNSPVLLSAFQLAHLGAWELVVCAALHC